jgi:hypothetical protein
MKLGSCKLCLVEKDLAHSHIFPEFFYEPTYDETNRFVSLSTHPRHNPKLFEKGLREYLLCKDCEAQFSRYESYAASVLRKAGDYRTVDNHFIVIPDFDYARFKLFGLSLIWRFHVSRLHMFGDVNLGPHAEIIRLMLVAEDPGEPSKYRIAVVKIDGAEIADTVIHAPNKLRIGGLNAYFFLAFGYEWLFLISNHIGNVPKGFPFVGSHPELVMLIRASDEKGFIQEMRRRMSGELLNKAKRAT